jgi:23S rRNA (cytidine1920-2'-O)/16S rRNA (cytidine1409-2'-O)-methyltransferase
VLVDGAPGAKPGAPVPAGAALRVVEAPEYVSRGGQKLANALEAFGLDVAGARALDVGASTGGFTDCLLHAGAREVVALDVGYGQLAWELRRDPRVHVMERVNARSLRPDDLPWRPDLVVCDVAFISVRTIWPAVVGCLAPGWRALVLVKPQFEVGRGEARGGVVRDPELRARAVRDVAAAITAAGGRVLGEADSGLPGPKGNREVFLYAADAS